MKQENLNTIGARLALLLVALFSDPGVSAAESNFYQQFTNALGRGEHGFLSDASLVDTNNTGPNLTNGPISFAQFRTTGEIAGIKLGMTMSEVVAVLGKPPLLYSHCAIGPRFWYLPNRYYGDLSLSFRGDRLDLIGVCYSTARRLVFDNGLSGAMTRADFEKILGPPNVSDPEPRGFFAGDIAYLTNGVRLDLRFASAYSTESEIRNGSLLWICVRSEPKPEDKSLKSDSGTNAVPTRSSATSKPKDAGGQR